MLPEKARRTVTSRAPQYFLRPPVILQTNLPTAVSLTPGPQPARKAHSTLRPPAVVAAGVAWHGPGTVYAKEPLRSTRRRKTEYFLRPPLVAAGAVFAGPEVRLTRIKVPLSQAVLRPPIDTIGLEDQGQVSIWLTYSRRGRPVYVLRKPTDTIGLEDQGQISTTFAPQRRGEAKSALRPPTVVASADVFYGPQIWLTYSRRGKPLSGLSRTPAVQVYALGGIMLSLAPQRRGQAKSRLALVLVAAQAQIYYGPAVHLTRIRPRRTLWVLRPPTILQTNLPAAVTLSPQRRGQPKSRLFPPQVVFLAVELSGPKVALAYSRRGQPKSDLKPPTDTVGLEDQGQISTTLAPQRRGVPKSRLRPPTVVFLAVEIYGPVVALARIKPPSTISVLRPPTDVSDQQDIGILKTHLAYSRRGTAKYVLRPFSARAFEVFFGPKTTLTRIRRVDTFALIHGPTAVIANPVAPLVVHLTYSRRPVAKSELRGPAVAAVQPFRGLLVHLTYSRRPVTKSSLRPPAVVAPVVSYGPLQWLTYSRRGTPKPFLKPPTVVFSPPAYQQVLPPVLTYSRRGTAKSFLKPPTRVFPFFARQTQVFLAPQSRGVPKSRLFPPTVLKTNVPLSINLTYSRRGRPIYDLRPPQVVRLAIEIYGPAVELTYSRRPKTRSELLPPTVVGRAPFRGLLTHLAYSRRGVTLAFKFPHVIGEVGSLGPEIHLTRIKPRKTTYVLRQPTVVRHEAFFGFISLAPSFRGRPKSLLKPPSVVRAAFVASPIQVHLTRITPVPVLVLLKPPSVVGAGIAFYGPLTVLTRIWPPKVIHALRLTLVAFRRPHGDVCGFDIAGTFVCSLETPGSQVSGSTSSRFGISGSSRAATRIAGSEEPGGSVSGSDRKAT